MRNKNTASAKLESKRIIFFQIGIIVSLAVALMAFEWKSYEKFEIDFKPPQIDQVIIEEVYEHERVPDKPLPKPQSYTVLDIIDDDPKLLADDIEIDVSIGIDDTVTEWVSLEIEDDPIVGDDLFVIVEEDPLFPGGTKAMYAFISSNINYPLMARENGIEGRVYVSFVVEKNGSISNIKIERGIGGGCDEEAVRVIKMMPRWKPGKQRSVPVRVSYNLPVYFNLQQR